MSSAMHKMRAAMIAVLLLLLSAALAPAQTQAEYSTLKWQKGPAFPEPEEELYGVEANGKMYVIGGFGPGGNPVGMNWEYDPAANKWTKKSDMALKAHHSALASYNGKIYVFGGFTLYKREGQTFGGWKPIDNVWEYNPVNDTWKALAPMPTKRGSPVAQVVGGKIYVIGGAAMNPNSDEPAVFAREPSRSLTTNEVYDPETNSWAERAPMPTPRNHAYAGVVNNKIYVIGGRVANPFITVAANLDIVEEYDPATDKWGPQKARMPTARSGGGFATYNGRIYVAGGEIQTPELLGAFRALEAYDPALDHWFILPSMPQPRHGVATVFLGNKLHLVSGKVTSGGAPDTKVATSQHDVLEIPSK